MAKSKKSRKRAVELRSDGTKKGVPRPVDVHVGGRVRLRRTLLGMSQEELGEALGVTFQQVQKYERGSNRISASRLFQISKILDAPITFFFDDMPEEIGKSVSKRVFLRSNKRLKTFTRDPLTSRETLELVRIYYRIINPKVRKRFYELAKSLANSVSVE